MNNSQIQLITQGTEQITVRSGEVPVICGSDFSADACAVMATNFLRTGAPAVQILIAEGDSDMAFNLRRNFRMIAVLSNEHFNFDKSLLDSRVFVVMLESKED